MFKKNCREMNTVEKCLYHFHSNGYAMDFGLGSKLKYSISVFVCVYLTFEHTFC